MPWHVTTQERTLAAELARVTGAIPVTGALEVGDAQFEVDGEPRLVVEMKTVPDFLQSIHTHKTVRTGESRWESQRRRLLGLGQGEGRARIRLLLAIIDPKSVAWCDFDDPNGARTRRAAATRWVIRSPRTALIVVPSVAALADVLGTYDGHALPMAPLKPFRSIAWVPSDEHTLVFRPVGPGIKVPPGPIDDLWAMQHAPPEYSPADLRTLLQERMDDLTAHPINEDDPKPKRARVQDFSPRDELIRHLTSIAGVSRAGAIALMTHYGLNTKAELDASPLDAPPRGHAVVRVVNAVKRWRTMTAPPEPNRHAVEC